MHWKLVIQGFGLAATVLASNIVHGAAEDRPKDKSRPNSSENTVPSEDETSYSHFEMLKELQWLLGDWIDEDENARIAINWKWGQNKNFLIQSFIVDVLDKKKNEGWQIVGWDPIKKVIRSWIFDSDGGFGQSYWTNENDRWYAATTYTLPDGRAASAVHIYSKKDNNTYTFASETREVDGKLLPNIGPFNMVKKQQVNP